MKKTTQMEASSADHVLVAFDFQYYFFLWKVLSLKTGESVGLNPAEVEDTI